jgi:hypothetical protein
MELTRNEVNEKQAIVDLVAFRPMMGLVISTLAKT